MPPLTIAIWSIVVRGQGRMAVKNSERECTSGGWSYFPAFQKPPQLHSISSRLLLKFMIFGLCCDFPPLEAETTLLHHPPLYSTSSAEWFYDFMLHFGHFVDIFNFRSARARAFTDKWGTLELQPNFQIFSNVFSFPYFPIKSPDSFVSTWKEIPFQFLDKRI